MKINMAVTADSPNAVSGFIQLRVSQVSDTSARFPKAVWSSATSPRAIRSNESRRPLYRTYEDGWSSLSNSYAPTRTLGGDMDDGRFSMFQQLVHVGYVLALAIVKANAAVANAWRTTMANQAARYWPEAHCMRGPDPKWRAKHAQVFARHGLVHE